jgi:uncharacterized protein YodC (DUF2158 family)
MPRDSKLKAGDIVQLKSGGPEMTIIELLDSAMVVCQWFSERPRECTFINDTLKLSAAKDPAQKAKEMRIKAGDMVKLKSGGPVMTASVVLDSKTICQWFDRKVMLHECAFTHDALDLEHEKEVGLELDEMSLNPGDVVQLKSGGPKMTVRVIENFKAVCQWFITYEMPYDEILYEGSFPCDALHGSAILQKMDQERLRTMEQKRLQEMEQERREAARTWRYDPEVDFDTH